MAWDVDGAALMQTGVGADKIYEWFAASKGPTGTTDVSERTWQQIAEGQVEISEVINRAVRESGTSWEGAAGDQARAGMTPLASWSETAGTSALVAGHISAEVGEAFREAVHSVKPPVVVPDPPWYEKVLPWDTDYDHAVGQSSEVNEHNLRVYNAYGARVENAVFGMPVFELPGEMGGTLIEEKIIEPPRPLLHEERGEETDDRKTRTGDDDRNGTGDDENGTGTTKHTRVDPTIGLPGDDDGSTRKSSLTIDQPKPIGTDLTDNRPPEPRDPRPSSDSRLPTETRLPYDPRNRPQTPVGSGPGGGGGRSGGGGGGRSGGGGGGGGAGGLGGPRMPGTGGGPGGGPGGGFGPGGTSGALGRGEGRGFGPGGGAGFGPGGSAAGRGGAGGMAGGGMGAGGARGEGDEDKEHKSASYLQETEDIFGDGTMVAPPVIGGE